MLSDFVGLPGETLLQLLLLSAQALYLRAVEVDFLSEGLACLLKSTDLALERGVEIIGRCGSGRLRISLTCTHNRKTSEKYVKTLILIFISFINLEAFIN